MQYVCAILLLFSACSSDGGSFTDAGSDSGSVGCGDGTCDPGETSCTCPTDCPATCGDGCCGTTEDSCGCAEDCPGGCCGDGECEAGETAASCPDDCDQSSCGDGTCDTPDENCDSCAQDCPCRGRRICASGECTSCGNGLCEWGDAAPRVVFVIDNSGRMGSDGCGIQIADDTLECPGADVECRECSLQGCENGLKDDGLLWKLKKVASEAVSASPSVRFALARVHMDPVAFSCSHGGWDGPVSGCLGAPLGSNDNAADILATFDDDPDQLLAWMDNEANFPDIPPMTGCDLCPDCGGSCDMEIRPEGELPMAGMLFTVRQHLDRVRESDLLSDCRPYSVILLTANRNGCSDPDTPLDLDPTPEQAEALCETGVPVYVAGFDGPLLADALDPIAQAGCGVGCNQIDCDGTAKLTNGEDDLAAVVADVLGAQAIDGCREDAVACASDCAGCNSDGVCDDGETACCLGDACPDACGDGCCTGSETSGSCPGDCS